MNGQAAPNHPVERLGAAYDQNVLVVTTENLPGYEIRAVLGEVLGVTACSRSPFAAGLASPDGGAGREMAQYLMEVRTRAIAHMTSAAGRRGATAIIGMRFDHRDITNNWIELCAYGTAVLALPVSKEAQSQDALLREAAGLPNYTPSAEEIRLAGGRHSAA